MYINGLKYACSTCIKGHRSSHCSHVDRPLFEIRKKGRPVTQCTFCRDLRKTKQVHIKCACSSDKKAATATTATTVVNANAITNNTNTNTTTTTTTTMTTTTTANTVNTTTTTDNHQQQPLLVYRNSTSSSQGGCSDDVCQDKKNNDIVGATTNASHGQHCTCPSPSAQQVIPMIRSPSLSFSTTGQSYLQSNVTQDSPTQMDVTQDSNSSILAPLCPTPPPLVKEENLSYSWALITSPSTNQIDLPSSISSTAMNHTTNLFTDMMMDNDDDDNTNNNFHLGFIFHKPTSTQRFLDGQPRVRRRRSTNQKRTIAANSATVTPTNYANPNRLPINALVDSVLAIDTITDYSLSTPPSSAVSPRHVSSSASSSVAPEPMDVQFDYLTEQLEILSSGNNSSNNNNNGFIGDLANAEELTAILNNVLQKDDDDMSLPSTSSYGGGIDSITSPSNSNTPNCCKNGGSPTTVTTSRKKSNPIVPTLNRSHCGSFVPRSKCCKPAGAVGGESVVITITPLTNTSNDNTSSNSNSMMMMLEGDQQQKTTTRIVTCYCGNQCTCPGCLVHPGNFLLGSDPYSGSMMNPSSSASSSCYGSDEEDMASIYSKSNNFISF